VFDRVLPKKAWYPVPLNVTVNVGEPRRYSGTSKEITAQVRADVEALGNEMGVLEAKVHVGAETEAAT
ncbi:MAG: hypothetical protein AAF517_14755, partial [Planctomycetota bacterium]